MSQRGIRIKLLVFDGKITISYTNYVFENATKNFVNTTKEPVYKAHGPNRLAENYTKTTLCGRRQAAIKRKTDAVEHRLEYPGKRGIMQDAKHPFPNFLGRQTTSERREDVPAGNGRRSSELREESSSRKPEIALPRQGSSGALCKAEAGRPDKITDETAAIPPLSASAPAIRVSVPA